MDSVNFIVCIFKVRKPFKKLEKKYFEKVLEKSAQSNFQKIFLIFLAAFYCQKTNETVLEVIDFLSDKTYYIHLDEKQAEKYEFDFDDDDDDFLLLSLDGIYKVSYSKNFFQFFFGFFFEIFFQQIYVGRDMPIDYQHCALSTQPIIQEIKEDFQYYLEW